MPSDKIPEPWQSFLKDLEKIVTEEVHLHCLGGFVVTQIYGLHRATVDLDVLLIAPSDQRTLLLEQAGKGAEFHKKHKVYLDFVAVASVPYDYDDRLTAMFPGRFPRLRLFALDPYDLVLTN